MSKCLVGREVRIHLAYPEEDGVEYKMLVPSDWSEEAFLDYVRDEHPDETVEIVEWGSRGWGRNAWWTPNPDGFDDFATGRKQYA